MVLTIDILLSWHSYWDKARITFWLSFDSTHSFSFLLSLTFNVVFQSMSGCVRNLGCLDYRLYQHLLLSLLSFLIHFFFCCFYSIINISTLFVPLKLLQFKYQKVCHWCRGVTECSRVQHVYDVFINNITFTFNQLVPKSFYWKFKASSSQIWKDEQTFKISFLCVIFWTTWFDSGIHTISRVVYHRLT